MVVDRTMPTAILVASVSAMSPVVTASASARSALVVVQITALALAARGPVCGRLGQRESSSSAEPLPDPVERREPDVGDEQADHASIGWRDREQVAEHRCRGLVEVERGDVG